jgi:tetratricopeptide (TPR) repeat protein
MARAREMALSLLLSGLGAGFLGATPADLAGTRAQVDDLGLGDDFGDLDDLGGDDFGDDFGDMGGDDLGGDDLGDDFGDLDDPFADPSPGKGDDFEPFDPSDDPGDLPDLGELPGFPGDPGEFEIPIFEGPVPGDATADDYLTAFADLLEELETRGVQRPFSELSLRRFDEWILQAAAEGIGLEDPMVRMDALLEAARDGEKGLPLGEGERLVALRGGSGVSDTSEAFPDPLDGLEDPFAAPGDPFSSDPFSGDGLDIDEDLEIGSSELPEIPDLPDLHSEVEAAPVDPFRIFRLRRELAAAVLRPLDGPSWTRWLSKAGDEDPALREGLGEAVGTDQGRRALGQALASGIPTRGAALVLEALAEHGLIEDRPLAEKVARTHPTLAGEAQRALGRIEERVGRYEGLDRRARESSALQLLRQAATMAKQGEWSRAVGFASEAAQLAPASPVVRYRQARYAYQLGWYQRSREALEAALAAGSLDPALVTTYTKVLRRQGDDEALVAFLERAFDQGGPTELKVKVCNELALEYSVRGEGAEAERIARIGLGYFVPPAVRDNLLTRYAEGLTLQGRYVEAERVYRQALALDPGYRKARVGLEAVLRLQGGRVELAGEF